MSRPALLAALAFGLVAASCAGPVSAPRARAPRNDDAPLWVLAPHPDDEALFGAEAIRRALRDGRAVSVIVMTNGDLGCERDGHLRERETVAAMAELGLAEERIHFLGYPDGALDALGRTPLPARPRRLADGSCGEGAGTYASRGEGRTDVHSLRTGAPAKYTLDEAVGDVAWLLMREQPSDVFVAHPIDEHPDHASTYLVLRRALEAAPSVRVPRVHRALVHVGGCWPNGDRVREPCAEITGQLGLPYPPLSSPLEAYRPTERVLVEDGGAAARRAIAHYGSQLHVDVDHDWLGSFARGESIAWLEQLERRGAEVRRVRAASAPAGHVHERGARRDQAHDGVTLHEQDVELRAPLEVSFDASVAEGGSLEITLFAGASPEQGVRLIVGTDALVLARGHEVLRRVRSPDTEGDHHWSLAVDVRTDEGGLTELELRRDGAPVLYGVDVEGIHEGSLLRARAEGATLHTLIATAR